MNPASKKTSLVVLAITAFIGSGILFRSFNDPEGANLLVVIGTAVIVYFVSLIPYAFKSSPNEEGSKKILLGILIQVVVIFALYFFLK